jgi:hypothetical protein
LKPYKKIILPVVFINLFILTGITLIDSVEVYGENKGKMVLSQEVRRDPFFLPAGVHPLSKIDTTLGAKGTLPKLGSKPSDFPPPPLKVKAILISDHIRLALIDSHIVMVGDAIHHEKVLEINTDRVVLGKGDQKRTLLLSQSPVFLTVEE